MKRIKSSSLGNVYKFEEEEEEKEALERISSIVSPYKLTAIILPKDVMSRGVQGDEATYTRVILLEGENPGWEILQEISTKITNIIPINRILFEIKS